MYTHTHVRAHTHTYSEFSFTSIKKNKSLILIRYENGYFRGWEDLMTPNKTKQYIYS